MRRRRGSAVVGLAVLAAGTLVGCGSDATPSISASPTSAPFDTPFTTTVTGLPADADATLTATSTDAGGVTWSASAVFRADGTGRLSTAQAPDARDAASNSYADADPMGLVETLTPGRLGAQFAVPDHWTIRVAVTVDGHERAHVDVTRLRSSRLGVRTTELRPADGGLYGTLYLPPTTPTTPASAVVVLGGSEGGLSTTTQAAVLASHGHPALALAYFGEPGLPASLEDVPLEYVARAAQYLAGQPGVDPARVVIWGTSRGSEAALLTASYRPDLVHGVIAAVPGAEASPGLPDDTQAAWTWNGAPVPTESIDRFASQSADRPATIPVERVDGPILLVCGGDDDVWHSCQNSAAIEQRLRDRGVTRTPTLLQYPAAGHAVGPLLPYAPSTVSTGSTASGLVTRFGGTYQADQAARAKAWPATLAWLDAL